MGVIYGDATGRRFRKNEDGKRRLVAGTMNGVEYYDTTFTDECSGCTEREDGHLVGRYSSDRNGATLGSGCDECGYTGKRVRHFPVAFDPSETERMWGIEIEAENGGAS